METRPAELEFKPEEERNAQGFKPEEEQYDAFKHHNSIYQLLGAHQRTERWPLRELISTLQAWTLRFNDDFKLGIEDLALSVDKLPKRVLGQHRQGHNGLGLINEVTLSIEHVSKSKMYDVLGTLLHELLHVWQTTLGAPGKRKNEHNAQFRSKARECGLIVNEKGEQGYAPDGPLFDILRRFGVPVPESTDLIQPVRNEREGKSKLALWICGCSPPQKVRVGKKEFFARCTLCHELFRPDTKPPLITSVPNVL